MKRLLFEVHRWLGIAAALFMCLWFFSGLVIIYAGQATTSRSQQLAHGETLALASGWLSLGEAWQGSAAQRQAAAKELAQSRPAGLAMARMGSSASTPAGAAQLSDARLVRKAGMPLWLLDDSQGRRFAVSALDGQLQQFSPDQGLSIARHWLGQGADVRFVATQEPDIALRAYENQRPFHRYAVDGSFGREIIVSARSGEVLRDSNYLDRALFYAGNYLHFFRFIDSLGYGESRRDVLIWCVGLAALVCCTGLIIGWLRWRPGWFGKPTYSQGRTQPYRVNWFTWHFWAGLIGGSFALAWTFSGWISNNPWQWFSSSGATKTELVQFQGASLPEVATHWRPTALSADAEQAVELSWQRLGTSAVLLATQADGQRLPMTIAGTVPRFSDADLLAAAQRLAGNAPRAKLTLQTEYDSYYYPSNRRGNADRPLPIVRVELGDQADTRLFIDARDGRLVLKQDASRRLYRWLFNGLHYWDLGWLAQRPFWDAWMLTWIGFGLCLSITSVYIGWKRMRRSLARPKPQATPCPTPQRA